MCAGHLGGVKFLVIIIDMEGAAHDAGKARECLFYVEVIRFLHSLERGTTGCVCEEGKVILHKEKDSKYTFIPEKGEVHCINLMVREG